MYACLLEKKNIIKSTKNGAQKKYKKDHFISQLLISAHTDCVPLLTFQCFSQPSIETIRAGKQWVSQFSVRPVYSFSSRQQHLRLSCLVDTPCTPQPFSLLVLCMLLMLLWARVPFLFSLFFYTHLYASYNIQSLRWSAFVLRYWHTDTGPWLYTHVFHFRLICA